jgi:hypothetical protein
MPSAEFETVIPATKRPQTYVLDRAATGIGLFLISAFKCKINSSSVLYSISMRILARIIGDHSAYMVITASRSDAYSHVLLLPMLFARTLTSVRILHFAYGHFITLLLFTTGCCFISYTRRIFVCFWILLLDLLRFLYIIFLRGVRATSTGWGIGFSPSSLVFPCQYHSTVVLHTHISSGDEHYVRYRQQFRDVSSITTTT